MSDYAIEFSRVSKEFLLHISRHRSLQEVFINRFRRSPSSQRSGNRVFKALKDISFVVPKGTTLGLIGNNGAGKSTVLKLISQVIHPSSGKITVDGSVSALLELGVGFHPDLTGRENVYLNAAILGVRRSTMDKRLNKIIDFAELRPFIDLPVKQYSSGMQARLGFALATHVDSDILIIDEVLAVGDVAFQKKCLKRLEQLKGDRTIALVAHSIPIVERLCDRLIWIDEGQIRAEGEPTEIISDYLRSVHQSLSEGVKAYGSDHQLADYGLIVSDIELINSAGEVTTEFTSGETLRVRVHYEAFVEIPEVVAAIGIDTQEGSRLAGNITYDDSTSLGPSRGRGVVEAIYPNLNLATGSYTITTYLYTAPNPPAWGNPSDFRNRSFKVVSPRPYHGPIELQVHWHHFAENEGLPISIIV